MDKSVKHLRKLVLILHFGFIYSVDSSTWGKCLLKPTYNSGWVPMIAQSVSQSQKNFIHSFGDWPAVVDIQVKPVKLSASNSPFVFPGIGSSQRDDDSDQPYGGVVYIYDKQKVRLFVPNRNDGSRTGTVIYTGNDMWNGPGIQKYKNANVRVRAWRTQDLPKPDFMSNWTEIHSGKPGGSFTEIFHGLNRLPQFVSVQVKLGSTEFISDGIGSDTKLKGTNTTTKWGGVIHGYDNNNVRIWTPSVNGGIFSAADGWGNKSNAFYMDGEIRVKVWLALKARDSQENLLSIGLSGSKSTNHALPSQINQATDLLRVTLGAKGPSNNGFHFPAGGAVQNAESGGPYGGLVYSYSDIILKFWYPKLKQIGSPVNGYLIYIDTDWDNRHTQYSTTVDLVTHIWKSYNKCPLYSTQASSSTKLINTSKASGIHTSTLTIPKKSTHINATTTYKTSTTSTQTTKTQSSEYRTSVMKIATQLSTKNTTLSAYSTKNFDKKNTTTSVYNTKYLFKSTKTTAYNIKSSTRNANTFVQYTTTKYQSTILPSRFSIGEGQSKGGISTPVVAVIGVVIVLLGLNGLVTLVFFILEKMKRKQKVASSEDPTDEEIMEKESKTTHEDKEDKKSITSVQSADKQMDSKAV